MLLCRLSTQIFVKYLLENKKIMRRLFSASYGKFNRFKSVPQFFNNRAESLRNHLRRVHKSTHPKAPAIKTSFSFSAATSKILRILCS